MKVKCPSCGLEHESLDYPEAFEIPCSCGYSILKPDENLDRSPLPLGAVPLAEEAGEEAVKISLSEDPLPQEAPEDPSLLSQMTPPEELPPEMPYDPFEISSQLEKNQESEEGHFTSDVPLDSRTVTSDQSLESSGDFFSPLVSSSESRENEEKTENSTPESSGNEDKKEELSTDNSHFSLKESTHSFLQNTLFFDLVIEKNEATFLSDLKERLTWLCLGRPWLKNWEKVLMDQLHSSEVLELKSLPEIMAVEFYILALEKNKPCHFRSHEP